MTYHLQSLALTTVIVSIVTILCLVPAFLKYFREFQAATHTWIAGSVLVVAADAIFFTGPHISHLSALLNGIAGLGTAEWVQALRLYSGGKKRVWWPYPLVVIGAGAPLALSSYRNSVAVMSVVLTVLYVGAAREAVRIREPERSVGRALLILIFGAVALVMVARLFMLATASRSGAPEGFTTQARALMFVFVSILPIAGSLAFVIAIAERLRGRLLTWSLTDELTGLANRRALLDTLDKSLAACRRRFEPLAVLILDMDHFKRVNDTAGHRTGDEVLVEITRRFRTAARGEDTVGRLGGEEFAVVASGVDRAGAAEIAERLRTVISATPIRAGGHAFDLTVSIGAVSWDGAETAAALLERGDQLLYEAKESGRNLVVTE